MLILFVFNRLFRLFYYELYLGMLHIKCIQSILLVTDCVCQRILKVYLLTYLLTYSFFEDYNSADRADCLLQ